MKQLGKLLIEEDMLTQEQLEQALSVQQKEGGKLGSCLVKLGFLNEDALYYFLAVQLGVEFVELRGVDLPQEIIHLITKDLANRYQVIPWAKKDQQLTFATPDPTDPKLF